MCPTSDMSKIKIILIYLLILWATRTLQNIPCHSGKIACQNSRDPEIHIKIKLNTEFIRIFPKYIENNTGPCLIAHSFVRGRMVIFFGGSSFYQIKTESKKTLCCIRFSIRMKDFHFSMDSHQFTIWWKWVNVNSILLQKRKIYCERIVRGENEKWEKSNLQYNSHIHTKRR